MIRRHHTSFRNLPPMAAPGIVSPLTLVTSVPVLQWVRADFGVGSDIAATTWLDQTQFGNDYTPSPSPNQAPSLLASDASLSGLSTIVFDGAAQGLSCVQLTGVLPYFIVLVAKLITWTANRQIIANASGPAAGMIRMTVGSPQVDGVNGVGGAGNAGAGLNVWERYQLSLTGTAADFLRRGATTVTGALGTSAGKGRQIGRGAVNGTNANFAIRELIHFGGTPTAPELAAIDTYIAAQSASIAL